MLVALQNGVYGYVKSIASFLYSFALTLGGPGLFLIAEVNGLLRVVAEVGDRFEHRHLVGHGQAERSRLLLLQGEVRGRQ